MSLSLPEVLEDIPVDVPKADSIFLLTVPATRFLGQGNDDFRNVAKSLFDPDGQVISDAPNVAFFSTGRLGSLKGGMLHLEDVREILNRDDIQNVALEQTHEQLQKRRRTTSKKTVRHVPG